MEKCRNASGANILRAIRSMMTTMPKLLRPWCSLLLSVGAFYGGESALYAAGLRWVNTPSIPRGFYWLHHPRASVGDFVAFCLPAAVAQFGLERGYLQHGTCSNGSSPLVKEVAALPGDLVEVQPEHVEVNHVSFFRSSTLTTDTRRRILPHVAPGQYHVQDGEVWLFSFYRSNSWDSRYYGPIPLVNIIGRLTPIFTIRE